MSKQLRARARVATAALVAVTGFVMIERPSTAAGTPDVSLTKSMPGTVLYGDEIPVTLTASGDPDGGTDGYNLSFNDTLPAGAVFGSSTPEPTSILPQLDGTTVVVWENVADLLAGASVSLDYTFTAGPPEFLIGDTVSNSAGAYTTTDARAVPDFDPVTGAATGDFTGSDTATATTTLIPFDLTKSEPSPEAELLRGVHDHKTVYQLSVDNNALLDSTAFTIVDFLPAGLEFLGCSAVDNSTGGTEEYTGAGRIDATAHPAMTQCAAPTSVTTVTTDPDGAGALPTAVYTRVEWDSASIEAAIGSTFPLAAGDSFFIEYAAAIPMRENVQATLTDPTANLDNNTGALTSDEQSLTNYATLSGTTDGTGYTDDATTVVTAEDLSIHKSVDDDTFVHAATATWTLFVESGEYTTGTDGVITITDRIPNGTSYTGGSASLALSSGPTDDSATGEQIIEWEVPAYAAPNSTTTITFETQADPDYRPPRSGPVAANDTWTNSVALTADATLITGSDGSTTSGVAVTDGSSASQTAGGVTIDKEVSEPVAGTLTCGDGSGVTWLPDVGYDYRVDDRVCWRLSIGFLPDLDTLNRALKDFLPAGYTYESWAFGANHTFGTDPADIDFVSDAADLAAGVLRWDLADADPAGNTVELVVSTILDDPSAIGGGDLTENLMKFSYVNTSGSLFQLREQAEVRYVEPDLSLAKSASPDSDLVGGDIVTYTVTASNSGFVETVNTTIVDTLPAGIDCTDVTNTGGATCADANPDTLTWTGQTIPRGTEVAPIGSGTLDMAGELVLSYEVTLPDTFDPAASLTNNVEITGWETENNTTDPNATFTDGPTATETITITDATFAKTRTTQFDEAGNDADQDLAIGEQVTYTLTVEIPEGTRTDGGVITDTLPTGIGFVSSSATLNGGPIPAGFTLAGTTLTFPDPYDHSGGAGVDTIVLTIVGVAEDVAGNTDDTNRDNDANFSWAEGSIDSDVRNTIVEPDLSIVKTTDDADDNVVPGQAVEYTLVISNPGSVAHDLVVVDTLPADVIPQSGGTEADDGDTVDGTGGSGVWDETARTITWNLASVTNAADLTLSYDTVVNNPLTGGIVLENSVNVIGSSLAGTVAGERVGDPGTSGPYSASTTKSIEAPVIQVLSKNSDVSTATVGDLVEYTVDVDIPAGIIAYDLTVLDQLPDGMAFEALTAVTCVEPEPLPGPNPCVPARTATSFNSPGDTGTLGFFVGDLVPGSVEQQVLSFVYTARVLDDAANVTAGADLDNSARTYNNLTDKIVGIPATAPAPGGFDSESDAVVAEVDAIEPSLTVDKDVNGQVGDSDARRAQPGDTLTYTVVIANGGTSPAHDVTVTDAPDARLTGYVFTPVAGVTNTDADPSDGTLAWSIPGPIAVGGSVTLTYTLTVPNTLDESDEIVAGPEVVNTADVTNYFGAPEATRTSNPTVAYREYTDVDADTVDVELDLASIGDRVWFDVDGDGVQDVGEPGLNDVSVTVIYLGIDGVLGGGDDETFNATTANVSGTDGVWVVDELPGGAYLVDVDTTDADIPAGLVPSYDLDDATTAPDGDWTGSLAQDGAPRDVDTGLTGSGSIGDTVWFDQDRSGAQNGDEGGIPGIDVTLVWAGPDGDLVTAGDNITYTDITDAAGEYGFANLPDGLFSVTLDTADFPTGMISVSDPDAGAADATAEVTLASGSRDDDTQDFGLAGLGSIGDTVYLDRDGDGSQDTTPGPTNEPGLEGVTVTLVYAGPDGVLGGGGDDETYTTVTDTDGNYSFENLPASDYSVTIVGPLPSGVVNTDDPDTAVGVGDSTSDVTLGASPGDRNDADQDFGYDVDSSIGDRVWWDLNRDGVQDVGEPGLAGVTVTVTYLGPDGVAGGGDDIVFVDVTDANGDWGIADVPDGEYTVAVTAGVPSGFSATYDDDSGTTAPDAATAVTLATTDADQDFGFAGNSSIGDTVWLDLDGDTTLDGDEVGIADVTVTVTWYGPDGVAGGGDDVDFVTTTADDGTYSVAGLPAGEYSVTVDPPTLPNGGTGLTPTFDPDGTATADTTAVTLAADTDLDTGDFGYQGDSSIGDTVYFDRDGDGTRNTTPGADFEPGLAGVDVTVTWFGPDGVAGGGDDGSFTVTTDANGAYSVGGLPAGSYEVDVDTVTLPANMTNTDDEDGDDDSNTPVTLAAADDHDTADFGYAGAASVGDTVYLDLNGDGDQDPGEPGVPGQTVTLDLAGPDGVLGTADDVVLITVTDADGEYGFDNLPDGTHRVTVVGGIAATASNTDDPDSGTAAQSDVIIAGGVSDDTQDFGFQGDNSVGDQIWWDRNRDGVVDAAAVEPRLAGVDVTVTYAGVDGTLGTADDIEIATVATDANGGYVVTGLPDGDYRIDVTTATLPAGMDNTADSDDGVIGDGGTDPDSSSLVNLPGATDDRDQDFGYAGTGSIGDTVYFDRDGDGLPGPIIDEPGIAGVEVTLTFAGTDGVLGGAGAADDIVIVQITDANGLYDFTGLPEGDYGVAVTGGIPPNATNSDDPDLPGGAPDAGDSQASVTLAAGEDNADQDFGFDVDAALGDRVWWDLNRDGVHDPAEPGLNGVEVTVIYFGADGVLGGTDDESFTTVTANVGGQDGVWSVTEIPEGNYRIAITDGVPTGMTSTFDPDTGTAATPDGIADLTGHTGLDLTQDFGLAGDASIGDTVWLDLDGDGTLDGEEVGLADVVVELVWLGPDGVSGGSDDVTVRTTTAAAGTYSFPGLPAGTYSVGVDPDGDTLPAGLSPSYDRDSGTVAPDGTAELTIADGSSTDDVDFGVQGGSSIGDIVFFDRDGDGVHDSAPGTDTDEPGLAGVGIGLTWAGEDGVIGSADDETFTTSTGSDGSYSFDGLPAGEYVVTVDAATLPGNSSATFDEDGDDNGTTPVTLGVDDDHDTTDFGYTGAASIGDVIFVDLDGDGVQGPGEPGVAGQAVTLVGPTGTLTTTTAADGTYSFDNLPDGDYAVTVTGGVVGTATNTADPDSVPGAGDSTAAVTLAGGVSVDDADFGYQGTSGLGDTVWFDVDADGIDDGADEPRLDGVDVALVWFGPDGVEGTADDVIIPVAATDADGVYGVTGLPTGTYRVTPDAADIDNGLTSTVDADDGSTAAGNDPDGSSVVTLAAGETNADQDFGFGGTGSIGQTVWLDTNGDGVRDPDEPGLEGAVVTLTWLGPDGVAGGGDDIVFTTTVADDGGYSFENLPAGEFTIALSGLPGGLDPTADPDSPPGGGDSAASLTLAPGASNTDQDFGYLGTAGVGDTVWLDLDDDGVAADEPGLAGVGITVTHGGIDGVVGTPDDLVFTTTTGPDGSWSVPGLPAGPVRVDLDPADLPPGVQPTTDGDTAPGGSGDPASSAVVLAPGATNDAQDFGARGPGTISGTVFDDRDGDGTPDGGEPGREGVVITITLTGEGGPLVITTTTDSGGAFEVTGLPEGTYTVTVESDDRPDDTISTGPTTVEVAISASVPVPPAIGVAFVEPGSAGGRVYIDVDRNGVPDAGEVAAPGVTVRLRDADGNIVATTVTDANGEFRFGDLPPGRYTVEIDPDTFPPGVRLSADPDGNPDNRFSIVVRPGQNADPAIFGLSTPPLPVTGRNVGILLQIATILLAGGWVLLNVRRRPRPRVRSS